MQSSTFTYEDHAGVEIFVYKWIPDSGIEVKAIVQISHGMAEHAARYERLAEALTKAGYACYADDHRGHGKTAKDLDKVGILGPGGWGGTVKALRDLTKKIKEEYPNKPIFQLGHSWGSFMIQDYIQQWGSDLKGVILSGTNGHQPALGLSQKLAKFIGKRGGLENPSPKMDKLSFGAFNKAFKPAKTDFDWLSRDEEEVRKYIDDSWCGWVAPGIFYVELLGGLKKIWDCENEAKIPKDLPIYLMAGEKDPVSNGTKGIKKLIERYEKLGMPDISYKFYPDGRHEMFNEINREEVFLDVINWLDSKI